MDIESVIKQKEAQIADEKLVVSPEAIKERASQYHRIPLDLESALKKERLTLVAPVSKASPEEKVTRYRFRARDIGEEYERAGCDALLVCTETTRYLGQTAYVEEARDNVHIPVIMHDIVVDEYQLYQALVLGADGVVLMTSVLPEDTLMQFANVANALGLKWIAQVATISQMQAALQCDARFIMIRNGDDLTNTEKLAVFVPDDVTLISEGAAKSASDLESVAFWGANAAVPAAGALTPQNARDIIKALKAFGPPKTRTAKPIDPAKKPDSSIDFPSLKDVP